MSLTTQIEHYAGSTLGYSSVIAQAINDGIVDVVTKVIALRPDLSHYFSKTETITGSGGVALDYSLPILAVERNGYKCMPGTLDMKGRYIDPTSLLYATKFDPVYYIDKQGASSYVYIKPNPTITENGYVVKVTIGTANDNTSSITYFPSNMINLVVLYSSIRLLQAKIETLRSFLPTDLDNLTAFDAISNLSTSSMIDNTTGLTYDLSSDLAILNGYIDNDEDIELAGAKMAEIKAKFDMIKAELEDKVANASVTEREYASNISKNFQAFSNKIQKQMQEYQIYAEKIKAISAEYATSFDAIGGNTK